MDWILIPWLPSAPAMPARTPGSSRAVKRSIKLVSIASIGLSGTLVIMTHQAREGAIRAALAEIDQLAFIKEQTRLIRIEDTLE
jgi:hypothetical protein